jgi:hypothetical protein
MTREEHIDRLAREHGAEPQLLTGPRPRRYLAIFTDPTDPDTGLVIRDYDDDGHRDLNVPGGAILLDWDQDAEAYDAPRIEAA